MGVATQQRGVPKLTAGETAGVASDVVAPLVARGVIVRRPRVAGMLDRLDADRRAVRRLQRLRDHYAGGPVLLRMPARDVALILDPEDVLRVLADSPEPFATATREKRAALSHFQPHGVLVSHGAERAERRRFNEEVLEPERPAHRLADAFLGAVEQEADPLLDEARRAGSLSWDRFAVAWWRIVRRVTLGDAARDDHLLTDLLAKLRADANWAFLKPKRRGTREAFLQRLRSYLRDPAAGSLAAVVASTPSSSTTKPDEQVPQWLFAFDAAGMAAFRALALLDARPLPPEPALLRAAVLESIRLWPTTPAVLRDTTTETSWRNGTLPAGAAVVIFAPFFHRDDERLPFADSFHPDLWLGDGEAGQWPLIPFSQGPGECPGRSLVLLLTSALLARLRAELELEAPPGQRLDPNRLPATLSPFRLSFGASG